MRRQPTLLSTAVCALLLLCAASVQATVPEPPFNVRSDAVVLMNATSGQILCAKNPDMRIPPASLTKIMTIVVALDEIDNGYVSREDPVRISEKAWRTGGSKMFVEVNTTVPLGLLLEGIAIVSGNDACVAVAEHIAGMEEVFVERMNRKAAEIGMQNTVFKNSHGLPADQHTTARDMALLARHYLRTYPESAQMHSTKEMTYNNITQRNRNGLLWLDIGFDGLKTGWFSQAGYHIVATASQDYERYIAVVMGAQNETQRENIAQQLITFGFRNFTTREVLDPTRPLAQATVWKGAHGHVSLGAPHALNLTLPRHSPDEIILEKDYTDTVHAPVLKGQQFGQLRVVLQEQVLASVPLVALEDIDRAGPIKLLMHTTALFFMRPPYWGALLLALILIAALTMKMASGRKKKRSSSLRSGKHGDDYI